MAARKVAKRRPRRRAAAQFLVVRGKGSAVLIARVQFTAKRTALARAIDRHGASKGVAKARNAFIVGGMETLAAFTGIHLGQHGVGSGSNP